MKVLHLLLQRDLLVSCLKRSVLPAVFLFQLEESEFTCAAAVKARKSMEVEIEDLHVQMEDISKTKQAVSPPSESSAFHSSAASGMVVSRWISPSLVCLEGG